MTELGVMRSCDGVSGLVFFFYHVACFVNLMNLVVRTHALQCNLLLRSVHSGGDFDGP